MPVARRIRFSLRCCFAVPSLRLTSMNVPCARRRINRMNAFTCIPSTAFPSLFLSFFLLRMHLSLAWCEAVKTTIAVLMLLLFSVHFLLPLLLHVFSCCAPCIFVFVFPLPLLSVDPLGPNKHRFLLVYRLPFAVRFRTDRLIDFSQTKSNVLWDSQTGTYVCCRRRYSLILRSP